MNSLLPHIDSKRLKCYFHTYDKSNDFDTQRTEAEILRILQ